MLSGAPDTEGSLTPDSLVHTVRLLSGAAAQPVCDVIERIRYTRVTSAAELVALLQTLGAEQYTQPRSTHPFPALLEHPARCLVVLDSLDEFLRGQIGTPLRAGVRSSYAVFASALAARGVSLVATGGMGIKVTRDAGGLLVPNAAGQTEFGPTAGGDDDLRNWRSLLGTGRVCRVLLTRDTPAEEPAGDVRCVAAPLAPPAPLLRVPSFLPSVLTVACRWALVFPRSNTKGADRLWSDPGQRVPFAIGVRPRPELRTCLLARADTNRCLCQLDGQIRAMGT